ncbi:MAG: hypothetical protein HQM11_17590 [SAR324 cluster bacterium]|nr:hypothetical protein [SAR324 cluster bacterium]
MPTKTENKKTSAKASSASAKPKTAATKPAAKKAEPEKAAEPKKKEASTLVIHYRRSGKDYDGWGAHIWNVSGTPLSEKAATSWDKPAEFSGSDNFGKIAKANVTGPGSVGIIVHNGDAKDPGNDMIVHVKAGKNEVWIVQGNSALFTSEDAALKA